MIVTLPSRLAEKMSLLPETGMGYQIVDVVLSGGRRLENCEVVDTVMLALPDSCGPINESDIIDVELKGKK